MEVVNHLYESAHYFDESNTAINLVPAEWNRSTVTDGKVMSEDTLSALKWRDVYLANTIEAVSGELDNKYIEGLGIKIDKETHTISKADCKQVFNFVSGVGYNNLWGNLIFTTFDESDTNKLTISDGELTYKSTQVEEIEPGVNIKEYKATINPEGLTSFPATAGLVFVSGNHSHFWDTHFGNPETRPNDDKVNYVPFDVTNYSLFDPDEYPFESYSAKEYTVYYRPDGFADIVPDYEVSSTGTTTYNNMTSTGIDPTDRNTTYCDSTTASGGSNFISGDIDMCPTGVLYIW